MARKLREMTTDFGNIYTNAIGGNVGPGHLLRSCIQNKNKDFASLYASKETTFKTNLTKLLEVFE